jgi:catechol-2,3-dioxygenase
MHPTGITANLSVTDLAEARDFYEGFLGLSVEGFNLGWVVNLRTQTAALSSVSDSRCNFTSRLSDLCSCWR